MQGEDGQGENGEGHPLKKREPVLDHAPPSVTNSPGPPSSILTSNAAANRTPLSEGNSPVVPPGRPPRMHKPTARTIDLNAILSSGPHEMEAETHILKAVEKITGQNHQRTGNKTARLYQIIAQDDITRALEGGDLIDTDEPEDEGETVTYVPDSTAPTTTAPGAGKQKFNGLVQATVEASRDEDVTLQETLFGFTNALTQMDQTSTNKNASVMGNYDTALKSADKLAANIDEHIKEEMVIGGDVEEGGGAGGVEEGGTSETEQSTSGNEAGDGTKMSNNKKKRRQTLNPRKLVSKTTGGIRDDVELFNEFLGGKKKSAKSYAKNVVLFVMLPSLLIAALLFHFAEEPQKDADGNTIPGQDASASWWILFIGVRLPITLTMALITQALFIDYLSLGSRFSLKWFGPIITLFVVQSKGWPFVSVFWGTYNLILLAHDKPYVRHWGYWQDVIGLFNDQNPAGNVLENDTWLTILRLMIIIGIIVSIKRLIVGLFLGRQTFAHFGQELATVMKNMVLVGAVATLAREIEKDSRYYASLTGKGKSNKSLRQSVSWEAPSSVLDFVSREADAALAEEEKFARNNIASPTGAAAAFEFIKQRNSKDLEETTPKPDAESDNDNDKTGVDGDFTSSEQMAISELLEEWEEPTTRLEDAAERKITIGSIMQFRQALTFMKRKYPFLPAFGPADSRERCIESSQAVYDRLLLRTPHSDSLPFETLALLAKDDKGGINQDKAKELIRIFRPERDGSVGKLEFVKSIDAVYKQLRLLSANISNSSQIDKAIESLVNVVFYVLLGCYVLVVLGQNPSTIFFSFSSAILGFAFMFGASAAKYFEGLLFIIVQRPYGVGDRIHLSNPQNETSPSGSSCWVVEKVTLTTTSVYWGTTNERATLSNGAISSLRVINAARSPHATVFVELKFSIDTEYEKIAIFRTAVEQFLKERPRQWLAFVGFRPTEVAVDRGFIGYKIIAQHRNHWQAIGDILESKANLTIYCLEVARQLEMRYHAPPLPVDLTMKGTATSALQALHVAGT